MDPWYGSSYFQVKKISPSMVAGARNHTDIKHAWIRGRLNLDPGCPLDPLIKSDPQSISTKVHDDIRLEDLYASD
jgi:hypothetical protein